MGSKASVQSPARGSARVNSVGQSEQPSPVVVVSDNGAGCESPQSGRAIVRRARQDWCALVEQKCHVITQLTDENVALRGENERLKAEVEELCAAAHAQNESLTYERMYSCASSHSGRTDLSSVTGGGNGGSSNGSCGRDGSPWLTNNMASSPDVARMSSRNRQRHHLIPMSDMEAYGKGLNPHQVHYLSRMPSSDTVRTTSRSTEKEDDDINGNLLE